MDSPLILKIGYVFLVHHSEENLDHPLAPFLYTISCNHCMTVSLAANGEGLGTMWGEQKARQKLGAAGFTQLQVMQVEGDIFNNYFFWGFLASFVIHILDEALLNGGFVKWIVDNFWPTYRMRMFFWFTSIASGIPKNVSTDDT